jgi:hypothetical protein
VCCGADKEAKEYNVRSKRRKIRIPGIIRKGGSFLAGSVSVGSRSIDRFLLITVCWTVYPPYGAE